MNIVIVGGGVSGVISAISIAHNSNFKVLILERNDKLLKKLLLTGNGRCNYFNEDRSIRNYHSKNMSLVSNFINDYNLDRVLRFYDDIGIVPKIKNGYYYPYSNQASSVYDCLVSELDSLGVDVKYNYLVNDIKRDQDKFIINDSIVCDKLILSTGSCAYPKTGSDGMGYEFLRSLGHNIIEPCPALVQLVSDNKYCSMVSGVRSDVVLSLYEDGEFIASEEGEVQLTDYGISGICTFNLSHYVSRGLIEGKNEVIKVNFIPFIKEDYMEWFYNFSCAHRTKNIFELLSGFMNKKVINMILKYNDIKKDDFYYELSFDKKRKFIKSLTEFSYNIIGTKGFSFGQICNGGVDLECINMKSCESKVIPNLYITGELLDINGNCGGYNLMMCVISGLLAGDDISDKS